MVDNYNRGDIPKIDIQNLKKELRIRAEEVRRMVKTPGWKYLKDFMEKSIENGKSQLQDLLLGAESTSDLKKLSDIAITIKIYKSLIDITNEFIKMGE